jgi:hypothetical protein
MDDRLVSVRMTGSHQQWSRKCYRLAQWFERAADANVATEFNSSIPRNRGIRRAALKVMLVKKTFQHYFWHNVKFKTVHEARHLDFISSPKISNFSADILLLNRILPNINYAGVSVLKNVHS